MPKIPLVNSQQLADVQQELQNQISAAKEANKTAFQAFERKIQSEIQAVSETIARNAATSKGAVDRVSSDAKVYSEALVEKLEMKLIPLFAPIRAQIGQAEKDLETKIHKVDMEVREAQNDTVSQRAFFTQEISSLKTALLARIDEQAKEDADSLARQRQELNETIKATQHEAKDAHALLKNFENQLQTNFQTQQNNIQEQNDRNERAQNELFLKIERLDDAIKELATASGEMTNKLHNEAVNDIAQLRSVAEKRLDGLTESTTKLRDAMSEVENTATRRVDWVIKNVSKFLQPPSLDRQSLHSSWFSPRFNAAGAHGLQLELQVFRMSDPPSEGDSVGDCAAFLWACKGMNLVYKLFVGSKSATLEKVFNGRVPYGTQRLCFLRDQINKEDDTLRVSVEILEAIRIVEHPVQPPQQDCANDSIADPIPTVEGCVLFKRHVNNRVLDQVKNQVDIMRSRMVRNIEWRVEQASALRKCFPQGEALCSASFNAAGPEGLQLIFYPSGYEGATDGFCSLFLFAPSGATLRCWLFAGNQKREASHSYDGPGAFGRTNFCRFESAVDENNDVILIGLEIEEAHQDVQASVAHPVVVPGDRRSQVQLDGSAPAAIESVVKLQRVPGRTFPGLEDKKVLPSLWTSKSLGEVAAPSDALHSFRELRGRCKGSTRQLGTMSRRSDSMPSLKGAPDLTGLHYSHSVPLPQLAQVPAGNWGLHCNAGMTTKLGKPRSHRRTHASIAETISSIGEWSSPAL